MRERKFRAYFVGIGDDPVVVRNSDEECYVNVGDALKKWLLAASSYPGKIHIVDYTGLKDKKGVEIYEGDLVLLPEYIDRGDGSWDDDIGQILFEDTAFRVQWSGDNRDFLYFLQEEIGEVIGNIHENPELIEV